MIKEINAKEKFLVLQIINIFQPIKREKLKQIIGDIYEPKTIDRILRKLIKEERVVKESKTLRATRYGLKTVVNGEARLLRDKYRMHYIYEKWKKGEKL